MQAQVTFSGHSLLTIQANNAIWAGFQARFAGGAIFAVNENKTIALLVNGFSEACFQTWGIRTMHAKYRLVIHRKRGILTLRTDALYSNKRIPFGSRQGIHPGREIVFLFAGNDTGVAARAPIQIYQHSILNGHVNSL
jgi:hypothetical protein